MPDELSKLLKKAYRMDRQAEKAAAKKAAEQPATKKKGKPKSNADKEQSDDAPLAEKPDEGS